MHPFSVESCFTNINKACHTLYLNSVGVVWLAVENNDGCGMAVTLLEVKLFVKVGSSLSWSFLNTVYFHIQCRRNYGWV
jgi:hypothetical protein